MSKIKVLYVSQEITPYLPETPMSKVGRELPQKMMEKGIEIRTFMPRFGKINERRHQLHEVIRLSGMNLVVNDIDHPLIIKVASIQPARMQVYFIDSEEYFHRKAVLLDENDKAFKDNDERSIFFVKGVLETVRKLGWSPDIIHIKGWMSSLLPLYLKSIYKDDPLLNEAKVVYSVYSDAPKQQLNQELFEKIKFDQVPEEMMQDIRKVTYNNLHKLAIGLSDAVVLGDENIDKSVIQHVEKLGKVSERIAAEEDYADKIEALYARILEEKSVLS